MGGRGRAGGRGAHPPSLADEALEDVGHNDKKIGEERITLAEAITATDPVAGHPVEEDSRVTSGKDVGEPAAPAIVKPTSPKDQDQAIPVNRVEGFFEVDFKHDGRGLPGVTNTNQVCSVDNVLGDTPTKKEPRLIVVHEGVDVSVSHS
jgi:hypothetical protein